ncbi:beta-1,3-glucanase [Flagelloscypha sp. PMI_526]|nr:beta-1,3-glucanase [Flagelloscypha sp. PMI_526]
MRVTGLLLSVFGSLTPLVSALGTSCTGPIGSGTAAASDPFWLQTITHQGKAPYAASGYQVFRNVKDFGAKGDGSTDDTAAIMSAMSSGGRCGQGCNSSTATPAIVYFPSGNYVVSTPIVLYYYTQLIGDAKNRPHLIASAGFSGFAIVDADPYIDGGNGAQWWVNQNNFFRSIRNFVFDTTRMPATSTGTGIHWQVSQATSLMNLHFELSAASNSAHQGMFIENGSGGFFGDLTFNGGAFGMWVGNQQFTSRNLTFTNARSAVYMNWNWGWSFQNINIQNCQIGFEVHSGGTTESTQTAGGVNIMDATVSNTPTFVQSSVDTTTSLAGSLVLNNIKLTNVTAAVKIASGRTVLAGGTTTIASWAQGNVYTGSSTTGTFKQASIAAPTKADGLVDSSGKIFGRGHPQYETYAPSQFVSVRSEGAVGDGVTDDAAAIKATIAKWYGCKIIFFDAGIYAVGSTIEFPAETQAVGEAWSIIAGKGSAFQTVGSPAVVVRAGASGSTGKLELTDLIFSTIGPAAGAIVLEWNVKASSQGNAGTWDTHIRLGGTSGTNLQVSQCPTSNSGNTACMSAFLGMHLTSSSSGYFEGMWVWNADHNMDGDGVTRVSIYSGRGVWSQSQGPVWMIGTGSEHHNFYQYFLDGAKNHFLEMPQTEIPYFQPAVAAPAPFTKNTAYNDPTPAGNFAWGFKASNSTGIIVWGAGFYSFFQSYSDACSHTYNCQAQVLDLDSTSTVSFYGLNTVGVQYMLSINEAGIIPEGPNRNGFQNTVTVWTRT